jgi:monofunctional chorismate mutase
MDIQDMRKEIDTIDDQLVQLFTQRMEVAARIADYKKENNLPIYVPDREQEKLADIAQKAGPEMAEYAQQLYAKIFELSRDYQTKRISEVV